MSWEDEALCKGKHHDIWFPPFANEREKPEADYYKIGKMVCEHCPVKSECLSLGWEEKHGMWGGTTPRERQRKEKPWLPEYVLIPGYIAKVPDHTPGVPLDIHETFVTLKRYADRRES